MADLWDIPAVDGRHVYVWRQRSTHPQFPTEQAVLLLTTEMDTVDMLMGSRRGNVVELTQEQGEQLVRRLADVFGLQLADQPENSESPESENE